MVSPFPYSLDNKRYHTLYYHLKRLFPERRVGKAAVDAGFTCPNLDGTRRTGGCSYCRSGGTEFAESAALPVREQVERELLRIRCKWPDAGAIAYFQSHTNTYAPADRLRSLYEEALAVPGVCGLSVATRADCLPPDVLDLLGELNRRTYLTVELGLQTIHEETARRIHRCHGTGEFLIAYRALTERGVRVCVHLIDGLPGETEAMMLETARAVGELRPGGVKLHLLHVLEGTALARDWRRGALWPLGREEYVRIVCRQLELLPPETVIERLTGDGAGDVLLAPRWSRGKRAVLGAIDRYLAEHDTFQGRLYLHAPARTANDAHAAR